MFFTFSKRRLCLSRDFLQSHLFGHVALNAPRTYQVSVFDDSDQAIAEDLRLSLRVHFLGLALQYSKPRADVIALASVV